MEGSSHSLELERIWLRIAANQLDNDVGILSGTIGKCGREED
jgi:hypothetical protein